MEWPRALRNPHALLRVYLCSIAMPWLKCEHYLELREDYCVILCSWRLLLVCWNGDSLQQRCECVIKPRVCVWERGWVVWVCTGVSTRCRFSAYVAQKATQSARNDTFYFKQYLKTWTCAATKTSTIFAIKLHRFCPGMFGIWEFKNKTTFSVLRGFHISFLDHKYFK